MKYLLIMLATSALIVAACSNNGSSGQGTEPGQGLQGYMVSNPSTAMFVWWTESDGDLTGSIYRSERDDSQESGVSSTETSFTATQELNQLTLSVEGSFGISSTFAGNLANDSLSLFIPDADGTIAEVTLRPANLAQYNANVAIFRGLVEARRDAAYRAELVDLQATFDAREAERLAYERSCLEHNGIIAKEGGFAFSAGTCIAHYAGGDFDGDRVSINLDGSWDREAEEFNRQICRDLAAGGFNAIYHEDTGVCEGDAP